MVTFFLRKSLVMDIYNVSKYRMLAGEMNSIDVFILWLSKKENRVHISQFQLEALFDEDCCQT